MAMNDESKRIQKAVETALSALSTATPPRVEGALVELETDEAGDPAVVVTVILADDTEDADWVSAKLDPIAEAVRAAIRNSNVDRYPYVRFTKWADVPRVGGLDPDEQVWRRVG